MDISMFLASVFAILLIILGIADLINHEKFVQIARELVSSRAMMFVLQFAMMVVGIVMVLKHNIWTVDYKAIITIFGWMLLIESTLFFVFPDWIIKLSKKWITKKMFIFRGIVRIIIGLYLASIVF